MLGNGRVKVCQRAVQNVAILGLARLPHERAPASGRPRLSRSWRLPGCFGPCGPNIDDFGAGSGAAQIRDISNLTRCKHQVHGVAFTSGQGGQADARWAMPATGSVSAMSGNEKLARVGSSERKSSLIKGYVKRGSFIKRKIHADSMASRKVASTGWLPARWLPLAGFPGFRKRIQHAKIVIPQVFDNESLFLKSSVRWIPLGFPGESACR